MHNSTYVRSIYLLYVFVFQESVITKILQKSSLMLPSVPNTGHTDSQKGSRATLDQILISPSPGKERERHTNYFNREIYQKKLIKQAVKDYKKVKVKTKMVEI